VASNGRARLDQRLWAPAARMEGYAAMFIGAVQESTPPGEDLSESSESHTRRDPS
jgi:hypothetical protein